MHVLYAKPRGELLRILSVNRDGVRLYYIKSERTWRVQRNVTDAESYMRNTIQRTIVKTLMEFGH